MKQQEKIPENKLNEMEASNLSETKCKIMLRMLNELRGRVDEHKENLNIIIVSIKKGHRNHKNRTRWK